jgi:hypothetical protein
MSAQRFLYGSKAAYSVLEVELGNPYRGFENESDFRQEYIARNMNNVRKINFRMARYKVIKSFIEHGSFQGVRSRRRPVDRVKQQMILDQISEKNRLLTEDLP